MSKSILPMARRENLIVQPASDELVVFDTTTQKAYVLSPAATAVWRACNGERSVQEIAHYLNQETPTNDQVVWYALGQLNDLLQEPVTLPHEMIGISRRQFLKRAGLVASAVAIPIVVKMVAPTPAQAQSGIVCCICVDTTGTGTPDCAACTTFCSTHGGVAECPAMDCG